MKIVFALVAFVLPIVATAQTPPAPSSTSVPSPAATATALPTPLVLPPEAPPQILAIRVNQQFYHSGDVFSAKVITSTNVPAVELRVLGKVLRFTRLNFGVWELNYKLPHVPRRFLRDYPAQIIAMNVANIYVSRDITLSLR
jgi:hypothetical protein